MSTPQPSELVAEKNYTVGTSQVAYVGEPVVRVKQYTNNVTITPSFAPTKNCSIGNVDAPVFRAEKGKPIQAVGSIVEKGENYYLLPCIYPILLIPITESGEYQGGHFGKIQGFMHPENEVMGKFKDKIEIRPSDTRIERVVEKVVDREAGYKNFEIVYTGLSRESINFLYREYTIEDMARAAFYQELTYPTDSKAIRFKSMKIELLDVNQEGVKYRVVTE
jgi:hypothetical protein